ncbi:uncharacterized protein [Mytilus edulis]|uniref:uncharacterized protein n=1 Tax=Mytilus edulis TaxID=6550 RepID=UPI0039F0AB72
MKSAFLVVLLLGVGYSNGMIAGMNPMNMMMAGAMNGGGQSEMMKMMALMSMMGGNQQSGAPGAPGAAGGIAGNPMLNSMMKLGLCRKTETAKESRFCTPELCNLKGMMRFGNGNMYQCVPGFGCCYKDHQSMLLSKLVN